MTITVPSWLDEVAAGLPCELAFATVSGAHLYGFPSADSDVDLRGVHLLPVEEVVGLRTGTETIDRSWERDGVPVDLVTHDLAKFCRLMLRRNGYVLEQLLSPLVVATSPLHRELSGLAAGCVTRFHAHHYIGFARTQWGLYERSAALKPLLYTFRALLTGIHLMRTGEVEADLTRLAARYAADGAGSGDGPGGAGAVRAAAPGYLGDLVAAKRAAEHGGLPPDAPSAERLDADVSALFARLEAERDASSLAERPSAEPALHDLVVRARLRR